MSRRSALKGRAPRLLGFHGGAEGKAYRKLYDSLETRYGPFADDLLRFEAGRVAVAGLQFVQATTALAAAQRNRREGKGRRPNVQQVERLARRQGLADGTYAAALRRLEELVGQTSQRTDLDSLLGHHAVGAP